MVWASACRYIWSGIVCSSVVATCSPSPTTHVCCCATGVDMTCQQANHPSLMSPFCMYVLLLFPEVLNGAPSQPLCFGSSDGVNGTRVGVWVGWGKGTGVMSGSLVVCACTCCCVEWSCSSTHWGGEVRPQKPQGVRCSFGFVWSHSHSAMQPPGSRANFVVVWPVATSTWRSA